MRRALAFMPAAAMPAPAAALSVAMAALSVAATAMPAAAAPAFSCGGFAMLGGAQLLCSHINPAAPMQICTFSWTLMSQNAGPNVVAGSFLLAPGMSNVTVYQGNGFAYALTGPIVLCQGRRSKP